MGEESGVPVGLFFVIISSVQREKRNVNEEEGGYMAVLFTSVRSRGGEKETLSVDMSDICINIYFCHRFLLLNIKNR